MKRTKLIYAFLLVIVISSFSMLTLGVETERAWMPSACYKFNLSVMDKFDGEAAPAKYVITSGSGRVFVAERSATGDSNTSEVIFPDDFHDAKIPKISASVDCFHGDRYKWAIYVNGVLVDSGTIGFSRGK